MIEQIWEDSGPFDGIMGFSQGAMLAAVVAAKGVLDPDYKAKPKCAKPPHVVLPARRFPSVAVV